MLGYPHGIIYADVLSTIVWRAQQKTCLYEQKKLI